MKKAEDALIYALNKERDSREKILDPLCAQLVDKVFVKMALLCRGFDHFYEDRNRLNAEKTQWVLAFTKLGLRNDSQIQFALTKLESHRLPNPPQLGEFLEWIKPKPESLGFPSVDEAYNLSIRMNQQFSDFLPDDDRVATVIKHAINQIGHLTYRSMKIEAARKTFATYYEIALRQFMDGKLELIKKSLPEKPELHLSDKQRNDEARAKAMGAFRAMGFDIRTSV